MDEDMTIRITDKGREVINRIISKYEAGESIEQIGESEDLDPLHIRVLITIDTLASA